MTRIVEPSVATPLAAAIAGRLMTKQAMASEVYIKDNGIPREAMFIEVKVDCPITE
jgi:hypothetical protein